ncbi:Fc.00g048730.m01.CDS01 [Cosmosporella sp. VM-42]
MFLSASTVGVCLLSSVAAACGMPRDLRGVPRKTAITNVHIFDGKAFGPLSTVVISGNVISNANSFGADLVDGGGGYLLPGLIDSHVHVTSCSYLKTLLKYGITTALDMGTYPYSSLAACKMSGLTDVRGTGAAGTVNGTALSLTPGFPPESFIDSPDAARKFVNARVTEGADYIKLFLDPLGPDPASLKAAVDTAHQRGKLVVAHATTQALYTTAEDAGVDIPCHIPLDKPIDSAFVTKYQNKLHYVVPTLIMMQSIVNNTGAPPQSYTVAAQGSVKNLYNANISIVAGSDANTAPFVPANPPFGESLHEELELLVRAGLSPVDAIRSATSLAASAFGLTDRGQIKTGFRADLVLLSADPTANIQNSRSIKKVWAAGVPADIST